MENGTEWAESVMWLLLYGVGMMLFLGGIYYMDEITGKLALWLFRDYLLYFS